MPERHISYTVSYKKRFSLTFIAPPTVVCAIIVDSSF
jgi:hypothetical protein